MSSNTKICDQCGIEKQSSRFNGKYCFECRNINRKRKRIGQSQFNSQQKFLSDSKINLTGDDMLLYTKMTEATAMIISCNHGDKYVDIVENLYSIIDFAEEIDKKIIRLEYSADKHVMNYLGQIKNITEASNMLRIPKTPTEDDRFRKTYHLENCFDEVCDGVEEMGFIMDAVKVAYNVMVDNKNSKLKRRALYERRRSDDLFDHTDVIYYGGMIIIDNNELKYSKEKFVKKLKKLIDAKNLTIRGHLDGGYYSFLFKDAS